jgi:hypothetical protein
MKKSSPSRELILKIESLVLFRNLLEDPVITSFLKSLKESVSGSAEEESLSPSYPEFLRRLYPQTTNFSRYLLQRILDDDNFFVRAKAEGKNLPEFLDLALNRELSSLEELSRIIPDQLKAFHLHPELLPPYETEILDFHKAFAEYLDAIQGHGYGIYRQYGFFHYGQEGLIPVRYPDNQKLSDLIGYQRQRDLVIRNTEALLEGKSAANILLYGDAGTGKSSTVKAIANEFRDRGLRLVEINKHQLHLLPEIMDLLPSSHLFFIIFVDDLSFTKNDDDFSMLKAVLEGGATAVKKNVVIYATTNRRHLVKESLKDRSQEELFVNDSLQETMSLSARFGLFITFERPDKDSYLEIVHHLATERGLPIKGRELDKKAETHALLCGGRSPRAARQFIDLMANDIEL